MTEKISDFIYKKENKDESIDPEIIPDRNYKQMDFQELNEFLNIKNYKSNFSSGKNIYEYLKEFNEKIFTYGLKIDHLATIDENDIYEEEDTDLIKKCDILEINIEKKRKRVENYKSSFEIRIEELIEKLKDLEEQPEIKYKEYLYNIISHMKRKEYHLIPELYHTEYYKTYLNMNKYKELKNNILKLEPGDIEKKILKYVFMNKRVQLDELENIFKLEKIELLKIIFSLQNKQLLFISEEDQSIKLVY